MKRYLIIGLLLIIVSISLTIFYELNNKYNTNINDITNTGLKDENVKVYLDATFIGGAIKDNNKNFYVMFGDGVQYLVLISDNKANEINKYLLDNPEESYHLNGVTKLIPKEIEEEGIKFVNNWLDANHHEDEKHNITKDDFYHYFGYVYLDTNINNSIILLCIICLTSVLGITSIFNYFNKKYQLL